jgi:hypothetical protein
MSNSIASRVGQINGGGATDALFLKLFAGEVFTEFERTNVFKDKHFVRPIQSGRSAQFPLIGRAAAFYHTVGNFMDGSVIPHAEKVISVGSALKATTFIGNIDEAMNHYEVRGPYASELGQALALAYDENVARVMTLAARQSGQVTGRAGGSRIVNAAIHTDAAILTSALFQAAQIFDEKDITEGERSAFFLPAQFYLLAQNDRLINKDLGGSGEISKGSLGTVANITLVKTNRVPRNNDSVATGTIASSAVGNFTTTRGIISTPMAAGTVQLMDMSMESEYEIRRSGTFMVASYAVGHDWLRPECAIELATA